MSKQNLIIISHNITTKLFFAVRWLWRTEQFEARDGSGE